MQEGGHTIIFLDKQVGETPLQALEKFRGEHTEYSKVPMTYAGRLDPMASGLLIILVGEAVHEKETYLALDKEYELELFIGAHTDTYDILGLIDSSLNNSNEHEKERIDWQALIQKYTGSYAQEYPPYSSKPVNGKPLFQYAREGSLDTITLPTKQIYITSIEFLSEKSITKEEAHTHVQENIARIAGDFRQEEILESWGMFFEKNLISKYQLVRLRVTCSSGTYIRSLVHRMGMDHNLPLCLWSLRRTRIGEYVLSESW